MMRKVLVLILSLTVLSGCMTTRNGNKADNVFPSGESFNRKKVAIFPVKSQTSLTTDSHTPLKKALNKKIHEAVKYNMTKAVVVGPQNTLDIINDAGKQDLLEKLLAGYESMGTFDKKLIVSLCSALKSDYLLLSKLKVEQLDMSFLAKSFSGSLEVFLLDKRTSEPLWSGIGDFKRMGAYGTGGTETDEAASELVTLAFGKSFPAQINTTGQAKQTAEPIEEEPVEQPVVALVEKRYEPNNSAKSISTTAASMVVIESKVKLRRRPSIKAATVKTINKGSGVQMIRQKDGWCLVELASGETGWCLKSSLAQSNM